MIQSYGWSDALRHDFAPFAARDLIPGRILVQQRGPYDLVTDLGELTGQISGRLAHDAESGRLSGGRRLGRRGRAAERGRGDHPRGAAAPHRLRAPGAADTATVAQVVAANVDVALLVASMNADLNAAPAGALPRHRLAERRQAGGGADQGRPGRAIRTPTSPRPRRSRSARRCWRSRPSPARAWTRWPRC